MQLATTTPGLVLGHALLHTQGKTAPGTPTLFDADVKAGKVLATGVTDIRDAATRLIAKGWQGGSMRTESWGLVGFLRNGDAWDAVELLAPAQPGAKDTQIWAQWNVQQLAVAPGVQLDAVWQVSPYGGDTKWRTSESTLPEVPWPTHED
jgi:hypothetical protein